MNYELEVRPYQAGDESYILALFRESYGRGLDERAWAWRFRDNPAGPGVIDLAWDGEILAAHYAVSSVLMRIDRHEVCVGLSGTTMTHPDYRGRGLFPLLARTTYERMAGMDMALVWGFPNRLSHRGFVRDLNWVDLWEIPTFRLHLEGFDKAFSLASEIVELERFDIRFDHLWDQVRDDYRIIVKRDSTYLQWRYVENPVASYRILAYVSGQEVLGYAVLKWFRQEMHIVDILTVQDGGVVGEHLVYGAIEMARQSSASAVSLWINVTNPLHRVLERMGFQNEAPVTYFGACILRPDLVGGDALDYRNWYLTMGDSDVY